ncbi:DUF6355 family natural product biosynthesis protein [Nonomuraea roseola]|uniref:DUF6355 family natural product biosynthesis protein n=1 Tax=Nonomuraea roseola TaxID=46179 RepID=A0ABV5PRA7_9ACTN
MALFILGRAAIHGDNRCYAHGQKRGGMSLFTTMSRIALATAAVGSIAVAAPAAQASNGHAPRTASNGVSVFEAPVGVRCGAYRVSTAWNADLRYWHCGSSKVEVEVDYRNWPNNYACMQPWQDRVLETFDRASHAWYTGYLC